MGSVANETEFPFNAVLYATEGATPTAVDDVTLHAIDFEAADAIHDAVKEAAKVALRKRA